MNFRYDEKLEKNLTIFFGALGTIAIIINLSFKGFDTENVLDAVKDIAGLVVVVIVFFVAIKINKKKKFNFNEKFEEYLCQWADANKYLIDRTEIKVAKGKNHVRTIDMVWDHESILNCNDASSATSKGAFMYLPDSDSLGKGEQSGNEISFKINKSMFKRNPDIFNNYEEKKSEISSKIANSIKMEFNSLGINAKGSADRIVVDFSRIDRSDENARKLIELVEFVKTLFLAVA